MIFLPPPAIAPAVQSVPPLSFLGFQAGMPLADAVSRIRANRGTLTCKPTTDSRMRDCTGILPRADRSSAFQLLISAVQDSSAVIVLSLAKATEVSRWVADLTREFGRPNHRQQGSQSSWQWIRDRKMLRVTERSGAGGREASVTLTHGPLLDGLGSPPSNP